jgi:hypothetical protein
MWAMLLTFSRYMMPPYLGQNAYLKRRHHPHAHDVISQEENYHYYQRQSLLAAHTVLVTWLTLQPRKWRRHIHIGWLLSNCMALYPIKMSSSWPQRWEPQSDMVCVGSEFPSAVAMKNFVFWDGTPFSLVVYQSSRGTYCLHFKLNTP